MLAIRNRRTGRENRMEEELEILIKSWTTESFSFSGQHYHIDNLSVTPKPHQKPHPPIWIGASTTRWRTACGAMGSALVASPRHHINELKTHYSCTSNSYSDSIKQRQPHRSFARSTLRKQRSKQKTRRADGIMYIHVACMANGQTCGHCEMIKGRLVENPTTVTFDSPSRAVHYR